MTLHGVTKETTWNVVATFGNTSVGGRATTTVQFADFNMVSSIGAFLFGTTQLLFLFIVIKTIRGGKPAPAKPWDGAEGLEWTVPSPAPYHTFSTPPEVK